MFWFWIIVIATLIAFIVYKYFTREIDTGKILLITGALKTGKSVSSFAQANRTYQKSLWVWRFKHLFDRTLEKPILYCNIQTNFPPTYRVCWLKEEHLRRQAKLAWGCTVLIDEMSMIARSTDAKDKDIEDTLVDFIKLFAHECNGKLICNTQALSDCHFAVKRCIGDYLYIEKKIPFFCGYLLLVGFYRNSIVEGMGDTNSSVAGLTTPLRLNKGARNNDTVSNRQWIFVPNKTFKYFSSTTYSGLTDHLPMINQEQERTMNLKSYKIVSLRKRKEDKK